MRARQPDLTGYVERDDVKVYFESFGEGDLRPVVFAPTDVLVTSQMWKAQVPFLARERQVVVIDPRGNGRSDKPTESAAYADTEFVADLVAVMDRLAIDRAVLGGLCQSAYYSLLAAATYPDRVDGAFVIGTWALTGVPKVDRGTHAYDDVEATFEAPYQGQQGWYMLNRELWLQDWPRWPEFFFSQITNDSHSSKLYEDLVEWGCQSTGAAQVAAAFAPVTAETPETVRPLLRKVACPVLAIHGTHDYCQAFGRGADVARLTGGELFALGGAGHVPTGRDPVAVNHAIADFLHRIDAGTARQRTNVPLMVRAHLSTRRDVPKSMPEGRALDGLTEYGDGPIVVLEPSGEHVEGWLQQLPTLAQHARVLVPDKPCDSQEICQILDRLGLDQAAVVVPPGCADLAQRLAAAPGRISAVLLVEAPIALAEQPALLDFFFDQLPRPRRPTELLESFADVSAALEGGRAPIVLVADDAAEAQQVLADAVVTVTGGRPKQRPSSPRHSRRDKRVLFLSSPIGLGHVRRDLAIADSLRQQVPGVRVVWLSQSPVTEFLAARGEDVHPASRWLASESSHIESEAGEHDLNAFQAIRGMDEILVNNFHVFDDLATESAFDLWIGDEAWELDHFLHENPRLKRAPFAWLTDFVGWVPMPDGGPREVELAADYNAEMVEHVARYPHLRDRSIFVGDPDDVVDRPLGPALPRIREWTLDHFAFTGYVMGERPDPASRDSLRQSVGYRPDETVCVVSVGGSGVGEPLLRRVVDAYEECAAQVPSLRMVVATGPRLDPDSLKTPDGVSVFGFLPDLDRHHAACDAAIVQGGLSTTMELTAAGRPFLYFPLGNHFEQQVHVRHRLERHGAGRAMDFRTADALTIASALEAELSRRPRYLPVPEGGDMRAAGLIAEIL